MIFTSPFWSPKSNVYQQKKHLYVEGKPGTSAQANLLLPSAIAVVNLKQIYSLLGLRHTDLPC